MKKYVIDVESVGTIRSVTHYLDLPCTRDLIQIVTDPVLTIRTDTVEA